MRLLRIALANRDLARLEAGSAVAALGTWTFSISLALYAYYEEGPGAVALAVAVRMLPAALVAPYAARVARAGSRRTVLAWSALGRFAALEAIAVVVWLDAPFALVLALGAVFEVAAAAHRPARAELGLRLARTPAEVAAVNAGRAVEYAGFACGAVVAGIVATVASLEVAFAVAGCAFVAVAALAAALPGGRPSAPAQAAASEPLRAVVAVAARDRWTRVRVGLFAAGVLAEAMLELLLVVAAVDMLGMRDGGVGWLRATFAVGGLVGALGAVALLRRGRLALGVGTGLALAGVPLALVAAWPDTPPALALLVILGGGFALLDAALLVLTQRLAPVAVLRRLVRVEELVHPVMRAAGAGLAAWLVAGLGDRAALAVAGVLLPALAVVSLRAVVRAERRAPVPERALRRLSALPAFAALPEATIENVALCAVPERFEAGARIDDGRFHAIEAGDAELGSGYGRVERLAAGDCFGAEALAGGAPPPATAVAATDVETLAIARSDFLARVTPPGRGTEAQVRAGRWGRWRRRISHATSPASITSQYDTSR